ELECFVHGAMCVAYSGRCLLSSALMGRDASRGMCTQPCRWSYSLVEEKRPGIYIPVEEAEGESYVFNSCDLRMIEHIPALAAAGIDSLKIEGRGKTAYYAAAITNAYRLALDGYAEKGDAWTCSPELLSETEKLSHRPYDTGFFFGKHDLQSRRSGDYIRPWDLAALQLSREGSTALLRQKNHFAPGDRLEWLIPRTMPRPATLLSLEDEEGTPLDAARHPLQTVRARFAEEVPEGAILRKMIQNP
ncbi:MAG: U32 family peptidase C-terminal domain-containing protein, partial [Clostridia bacterium]|nr:U32 family peptidase C-terminal domain-containing protein [Clostridia bacterium]